jgi:hypothetical protein
MVRAHAIGPYHSFWSVWDALNAEGDEFSIGHFVYNSLPPMFGSVFLSVYVNLLCSFSEWDCLTFEQS